MYTAMTPDDPTLMRLERAISRPAAQPSSDFDLNRDEGRKPSEELRPAAVLISLVADRDGWRVILTKRTAAMRHHPGQIAFPGGKMDAADPSLEDAALREAHEEIGLEPEQVRIIGALAPHETVTGFKVTPFLGVIEGPFVPVPHAGEVDEVFAVPLEHLMEPSAARIEGRMWHKTKRHYYVIPYGPYYIWGATARMIIGLRALWEAS